MRFEWDEHKNRRNFRKLDVRFETAVLVFDDPYAITQRDVTLADEERWITVGAIGPGSILKLSNACTGRSSIGRSLTPLRMAKALQQHSSGC
jgi:uncharacterized protein